MDNGNKKSMSYSLNLEEIIKFVFENENTRESASEIQENYENEGDFMKLRDKSVKEVKTKADNSNEATIRYDLIKTFITSLFDIPAQITNNADLTLGDTIVINTLISNNMLTEIN